MSTRDVTLRWDDTNVIEKGHKVYRSNAPMDINNMPPPIGVLEPNSTEYIDKDQTIGNTNYYRVSAWIDGHEVFSDEFTSLVEEFNGMYLSLATSDPSSIKTIDIMGNDIGGYVNNTVSTPQGSIGSIFDEVGNLYSINRDSNTYYLLKYDPIGQLVNNVMLSHYAYRVVYHDGKIFVSSENTVYVYNTDLEHITEFVPVPDRQPSSGGLDLRIYGNYIYATGTRFYNTIVKMNMDGSVVWSYSEGNTDYYDIVVKNGKVYLPKQYGSQTMILDDIDGSVIATYPEVSRGIQVDDSGNIYIIKHDGTVVKLNSNLEVIWTNNDYPYTRTYYLPFKLNGSILVFYTYTDLIRRVVGIDKFTGNVYFDYHSTHIVNNITIR